MSSPVDTLKVMRQTWDADLHPDEREALDAAIAALSGGEAVAWFTEDYKTDKSATTYDPEVAARWRNKGWPVGTLYTTPRIPDGIDGQVIALLVAGGFVSQAKVDEARNIAISAAPGDEGRGEQRAKPFDYRKHYPPMQPDCNGRATTGQTPEDWIERAARCAEEILQCELADIPAREESKSIEHLAWMAMKLAAKDVGSATKTCRWLGYLQGALVTFGYSTLETEKKRNLRSVAPPAAPREE